VMDTELVSASLKEKSFLRLREWSDGIKCKVLKSFWREKLRIGLADFECFVEAGILRLGWKGR